MAMTTRPLPERWRRSEPALRAVQVAFDVSEQVMEAVRNAAFVANRSTSDQIRAVLGLDVAKSIKRPRLTVSLSPADYLILGERFGIDPSDHLAIKERVNMALIAFSAASIQGEIDG